MRLKHALILPALLFCTLRTGAQNLQLDSLEQRYRFYSQWCAPEKLFIHLDRTYYAYGETIWFNGYLKNATPLAVIPESNFIYVELLDPAGNCVVRVKVKRDPVAGFPGRLAIPENMDSGMYTLRAYTLWNLNNPEEYMFHQQVKILGPVPLKKASEHQGKVDVSFYPEGGRYFAGCRSVMGFKVMDRQGRSVDARGWLVDDSGRNIAPMLTVHDGMGAVEFVPVQGRSYSMKLDGMLFPLPEPSMEGASVQCSIGGGYVYLTVNGITHDRYRLYLRDAENLEQVATVNLDGESRVFKIGLDALRGGINHILLADSRGNIVSERLFYVPDGPGPRCSVERKSISVKPREPLCPEVRLTGPDGAPLDGRFSVSVVRGSFAGYRQNDDIVSYMRLSGELRGTINSPSHYFDESVDRNIRARDLDLLMMIQGWRYYDMAQVEKQDGSSFKLKYVKEMFQSVKGRITRVLSSRIPKKFLFTVIIPRRKVTLIQDVDQARYFEIDSLDLPENTGILIKVSRLEEGLDYMPKWNGDVFAPPFRYAPAPGVAGGRTAIESIPLEANLAMTDTIQAAVVSARVDPFPNLFGGRTATASELAGYGGYSIVDYVRLKSFGFIYSDGVMSSRRRGGGIQTGTVSTEEDDSGEVPVEDMETRPGSGAVKLVVDDCEQPWELFETVTMDDVEAISISTSPDWQYNSPGGLVAVKLKSGVLIERDFTTERSIAYFVPLGYQTPKAFYSPRYDRGDTSDFFDNRNTIHWDPCVTVTGGRASVEFCNTDQCDYPYLVDINGVTASGAFFRCHAVLNYR